MFFTTGELCGKVLALCVLVADAPPPAPQALSNATTKLTGNKRILFMAHPFHPINT